MKHKFSVENKNEAIYYNRKVYDSAFGDNYDIIHNLSPTHYVQKIIRDNVQNIIKSLSGLKEHLNLIDIGTGTGSLSLHYYKFIRPADTVFNLDLSENMLGILKKKLTQAQINQSHFIADDAHAYLSNTNLKFDLIGFAGCLHHFYDYMEVLNLACKKLAPNGYLYIAFEPKQHKSYIEYTLRNFEAIISRYKNGEFGLMRGIIKFIYTPFHFLNGWFGINLNQVNAASHNYPDQHKTEVVLSGLDLKGVLKTFETNKLKLVKLSGGPDYAYFLTYKVLNLLRRNSHFQLIARKESE